MSNCKILIASGLVALAVMTVGAGSYEPNWESLDSRPVAQWWVDAKFGIFVCWGLYSVPAYAPTSEAKRHAGYAEWYQGRLLTNHKDFVPFNEKHYGKMPYANHVKSFTCEHFNADEWAALFKRSGAKYTILTSKYHDGYALWPSAETPYYNSVPLGPGRDLCAEFTTAMKKAGIKSGFYYSLLEFANPLYPKALPAVRGANPMSIRAWSAQMNLPQMKDLVTRYQADLIWPDGDWDYPDGDFLSEQFLAWLFNESPVKDTVAVNDRWGKCRGKHGGFYTTEYGTEKEKSVASASQHPWEENRGIGYSFGLNKFETTEHYLSNTACVELLVSVVSRGGNLLLDVGPDPEGMIPVIMQERLLQMGAWLDVNGEGIYGTRKFKVKLDGDIRYTKKDKTLYAFIMKYPFGDIVLDDVPYRPGVKATLLGYDGAIATAESNGKTVLRFGAINPDEVRSHCVYGVRLEGCLD